MNNFKKLNNIVGWIIFCIATTTYILTADAKGSFYDCGEFLSCAFKLQVPHPPGSPLFVLLGRIFVILSGDNIQYAAKAINLLSAFASGFTILFLFWIITLLAKKLIIQNNQFAKQQHLIIIGCGIIGALTFAFTDTFWYNAVEAEVYALSAFFTAIVFWAILKWEEAQANYPSDKWIIFIFFMIGLAIGVHLLNLLVIPAIVLVYYFKKYTFSFKGFLMANIIGIFILGIVQIVFIQYTISMAGYFDMFFVNSLGLPFFTGFICFYLFFLIGLFYLYRYGVKKQKYFIQLGVWCTLFLLIGYSTYSTTVIRANSDIPINMYVPNNPMALVSYLSRDQYDDAPLLYGPDYIEVPTRMEKRDIILKRKNNYVKAGKLYVQNWANTQTAHLFPRMFNSAAGPDGEKLYQDYGKFQTGETPTMMNNIGFFINYQVGWMFLRYFMINFVGKQNDLIGYGNFRDGNYISGINFIDNWRLGQTNLLPDSIGKSNKAHNKMFYLPLLMGLLGFIYQYKKNKKSWFVLLNCFFFTSIAIVVYSNQSSKEPRETDYIYVGAFMVFSIWIGLALIPLFQFLQKKMNPIKACYVAFIISFIAVPFLMGQQGWDDHDRSKRTLALDMAINYLESCPPNALLFIFTDNDLYPLLYAQEVEGIRTDVRIVSNNLGKAGWHITRLLKKQNQSMPFDIIFKPEQIEGARRNVIFYHKLDNYNDTTYYALEEVFRKIISNDSLVFDIPTNAYPLFTEANNIHIFPTKKFSVPVSKQKILQQNWVSTKDKMEDEIKINFAANRDNMIKNEIMMYALIASTKWERPICFTSKFDVKDLGIDKYLTQIGLVYQLTPVLNKEINIDAAYNFCLKKCRLGNPTKSNIYFDSECRTQLNLIKSLFVALAEQLIKENKLDSANKILVQFDNNINTDATPYGVTNQNEGNMYNYYSFLFLKACFAVKNKNLFKKVAIQLKKDMQQQFNYYKSLGNIENDQQLFQQAELTFQGKESDLNDAQKPFKLDILGSSQMIKDIANLEKNLENLK